MPSDSSTAAWPFEFQARRWFKVLLSGSADPIIGLLLLSLMAPPFLLELTILNLCTQKILHLGPYDKIDVAGHDPIKIFSA